MNIFQYKWNPAVKKLFFPVGGTESWSIRFNKCNDHVKEMREKAGFWGVRDTPALGAGSRKPGPSTTAAPESQEWAVTGPSTSA